MIRCFGLVNLLATKQANGCEGRMFCDMGICGYGVVPIEMCHVQGYDTWAAVLDWELRLELLSGSAGDLVGSW